MPDPELPRSPLPFDDSGEDLGDAALAQLEREFEDAVRGGPAAPRATEPGRGAPRAAAARLDALEAVQRFGDPHPDAPAPTRPSFRASLRASFVSGRFEGDGAPPSSVARALDAYDLPRARPEFHARARAAFLTAQVEVPRPSPARGAAHERPARPARPAHAQRQRAWGRLGAALAVAAALAAVFLWPRPEAAAYGWSVVAEASATKLEGVRIDGAPSADAADVRLRLVRGGVLETGDTALCLVLADELIVEFAPHSRATLPALGAGADVALHVEQGGLHVATGATFRSGAPGRRLTVRTIDVEAEALGTVFGVERGSGFTCICCLEGEVLAHSQVAGVDDGRVLAGRTRLTYSAGRTVDRDLVPAHGAALSALRAAWRKA